MSDGVQKRIGLFGGTFNPIHLGHVHAAETVKEKFLLDTILFIPSYIPPHKDTAEVAAAEFRLDMVKLAVSGHAGFQPSSIEIDAGGKSYSINTLAAIKRIYPQAAVFFILGIDAFLELDTWMDYKNVLQQCCFIVISRPGYSLHAEISELPAVIRNRICDSSCKDPGTLGKTTECSIFLFSMDSLDIASTEIRRRVHTGEEISGMASDEVIKYIKEKKLYK